MIVLYRQRHTALLAGAVALQIAALSMGSSAASANPSLAQRTSGGATPATGEGPPASLTKAYPLNTGRLAQAHPVTSAPVSKEPTGSRSGGDVLWLIAGAALIAFLALVWANAGGVQRLRWRKQAWSASRAAKTTVRFRHEEAKVKEEDATIGREERDSLATKIIDPRRPVRYTPSFAKRGQGGDAASRGRRASELRPREFGGRGRLAVDRLPEHGEEVADEPLE